MPVQLHPALNKILSVEEYKNFPQVIKRIETAICRYATPSGCCNTLVYLMQRIKNMLLSIFGCSDWQRAVRSIKGGLKSIVKEEFNEKEFKALKLSEEDEATFLKYREKTIPLILNRMNPTLSEGLDLGVRIQSNKFKTKKTINNEQEKTKKEQEAIDKEIHSLSEKFNKDMDAVRKEIQSEFKEKYGVELFNKVQHFLK